eukprot:Gb_04925 [translate_table: standard]
MTLYGLKQALRAWYEKIDRYFLNTRFVRSSVDSILYMKVRDSKVYDLHGIVC